MKMLRIYNFILFKGPSVYQSGKCSIWVCFLLVLALLPMRVNCSEFNGNIGKRNFEKSASSVKVSDTFSSSTFSGPNFIQEPPNYVEFSNSTGSSVECSASGMPLPDVYWILPDGAMLHNVSKLRTVFPNGTLLFYPFRADDYTPDVHSLVYRCAATNVVGTIISRPIHVRAVVLQVYEAQVYDDFVMRGNTAILRCQIPSFVSEYVKVTTWIKDTSNGVDLKTKNDSKYTVLPYGELYIHDVDSNDSLQGYRCRTLHKLTGEQRSSSIGKVMFTESTGSVSPRITDSKSTVQAKKGDSVVLPCLAQGLPPPTYTWYRKANSGQLINLPIGKRYYQNHGVLNIQNVEQTDAGTYICKVQNSLGDEKAETNLVLIDTLTVHVEPRLRVVERGKSTSFRCSSSGYPIISMTWFRNGKVLSQPSVGTSSSSSSSSKELLSIDSVSRQEAGMYQCFVKNTHETVQATAELRLGDSSPEIIWGFSEELRHPGMTVTLKCVAAGNPAPAFSWALDELSLPASDRFRVRDHVDKDGSVASYVTVNKVQVEDGGLYRCNASNKAGQSYHAARLNVHGLPFVRALPKLIAVEGSNTSLSCPASGYPIDAITWMKGDLKVPFNHRQKVFPNGTLLVSNVQRALDSGKYTCEASNNQGQSSRRDFEVDVLVPPKIVPFFFQDDQNYEGMRVSVFCAISQGEFPMDIKWYKDDEEIPSYLKVNTQTLDKLGSTLSIERVNSAHGGKYTCSATNTAATVNYTAQLTVNVPPRWVVEPKDVSVLAGKDVHLDCLADGFPRPSVIWMKAIDEAAGEFTDVMRIHSRFSIDHKSTLTILDVQESDHGRYMCKASNSIGAGLSKVVTMNVQVPSRFDVKFRNQTVKNGDDAQLSCTAKGDVPLEIIWRINGKSVAFGPPSRYKLREHKFDKGMTSYLIVSSVGRGDSAKFSCLAKNPHGHDETHIYLFILERPEPPSNIWIGDHGSRSTQVSWVKSYHGNSPVTEYLIQYKTTNGDWATGAINKSLPYTEGVTTLQNLRPATSYHVRIFAVNELGISESSKIVSLTTSEEAPGGPPRDIKVEAIDSQTLKITWKAPKKEMWNGNIGGYHVGFKLYNSTDPHVFKTIQLVKDQETNLVLQLNGLHRFTRYGIIVRAFNDHGNGPDSDEIVAMTAEDVPNLPPIRVQCFASTSQSLHINWEPPPPSSIHGVLQGYKVLYRRAEERYDDEPYETKMTSVLKTMLHGLMKYTNYSIQILAFTRVGDGERSKPIFCRTQDDVPSAPSAAKAVASSADGILVTWKPPLTPNGEITKYTVYMRTIEKGNEETSKFLVPAGELSKEIKELKRNTPHEFWVTASTRVGEGQSTKVISQNTSGPFVPSRIASLSEQILAVWQTDVKLECIAVGIPKPEIKWLQGGNPLQSKGRTSISPQGTLVIKSAQSEDSANYTCVSRNDYGRDSVVYQVVVEVPPEPPVVSIIATSMTSLKVQWRDGYNGGRTVRGYTLNYRSEFGHWSEVQIDPGVDVYLLKGLQCGTRYQLFMTAYNKVGTGAPSQNITMKTKGSVPESPPKEKLIVENSTFIILKLDNWYDGGCPILYFVVEYKQKNSGDGYTLVSNNVKPDNGKFVVADLAPSSWYSLKMTAHSSAGSNTAVYEFVTLNVMGDSPPSMDMQGSKENPNLAFDIRIIILSVVALVVVIVVLVLVCFWFQRKKLSRQENEKKFAAHRNLITRYTPATQQSSKNSSSRYNPNHLEASLGQNTELPTTNTLSRSQDGVNPYATSQILQVNSDRRESRKLTNSDEINSFAHNDADGDYPARYPSINDLYSKVEKSVIQVCPKHHLNQPQDTDVPDLLEHSLESSSSNETSPQRSFRKSYRALELIDRTDDWARITRDNRFISQAAETTFIYNSKHDLQPNCSDLHDELSEAECDREDTGRYRQTNSYLIDYSRRLPNADNSVLMARRHHWKPCSYLISNRKYNEEYNVPI